MTNIASLAAIKNIPFVCAVLVRYSFLHALFALPRFIMGDQYESIGDPAQGDAGAPPPPPPGAPAADAAPDNNNSGYKSAGESVPQPEPVDDQGKQPPADVKPEDVPPPEGAADQSNQPQTDLKVCAKLATNHAKLVQSAPQDGAGPPPPEAAAEVPKKKAPVAPVGGPTQVISATGRRIAWFIRHIDGIQDR